MCTHLTLRWLCYYYGKLLLLGREPDIMKVPGISPDKQELQGLETSVKMGLDLEYEKDGKKFN